MHWSCDYYVATKNDIVHVHIRVGVVLVVDEVSETTIIHIHPEYLT